MLLSTRLLAPLGAAIALTATVPAHAQDDGEGKLDIWVLIGAGPQIAPSYPGASDLKIGGFPEFDVWRDDRPFPIESPDEGIGPALIGRRGDGPAAGVTVALGPTRSRNDIPGLRKIGFGLETGVFAETFLTPGLRARGEVRQAIGSHEGLVGDLMIDAVIRDRKGRFIATVGPRARWGDARFHRALFGIDAAAANASALPGYNPGAGICALGAAAGAHYFLTPSLGIYGFARYDRLQDEAAASPIVRQGSRDQFSTGAALTYRFRIRR